MEKELTEVANKLIRFDLLHEIIARLKPRLCLPHTTVREHCISGPLMITRQWCSCYLIFQRDCQEIEK